MYDGISVVTQASYEPFVIESQLLSSGVRFMDVDFAGDSQHRLFSKQLVGDEHFNCVKT